MQHIGLKRVESYCASLWHHRSILKMMVKNDLKGRFKYTALGYFWHLLNPLAQIVIYLLIFTVIFGKDIPNYWVYISTGMFYFSFFLQCSSGSCNLIINNSRIITKMSLPREIIVISKVLSNLITWTISYCLLIVLIVVSGVGISIYIIYLPILVILFAVFCLGLALALSAITVYFRDFANIMSILMGCMMFAIPIFYVAGQRSTPMMEIFWSINPLYYYVEAIHNVLYTGCSPTELQILICVLIAPLSLFLGLFVFKKLEIQFAERL